MYFVIACIDKPGQPELRQDNRPDHLAYLEDHAGRIVAAGPRNPPNWLSVPARALFPGSMRKNIKERVKQLNTKYEARQPMSDKLRRRLSDELRPDIEKLSALVIGRACSKSSACAPGRLYSCRSAHT